MLSTRGDGKTMAQEIWRARDPFGFDWRTPPGWRSDDVTAAAFLAPSFLDQHPVAAPWHPDTRPTVAANASAVAAAQNDNVSDLDLCTITTKTGNHSINTTVMYFAWGDQQLGPTAMVLSLALVPGMTEGELLASHFDADGSRL